jgi:hypothetical protein
MDRLVRAAMATVTTPDTERLLSLDVFPLWTLAFVLYRLCVFIRL